MPKMKWHKIYIGPFLQHISCLGNGVPYNDNGKINVYPPSFLLSDFNFQINKLP